MKKKLIILSVIFILIINASSLCVGNPETDEKSDESPPYEATNPSPENNSICVPPSPTLSVEINDPPDPDGDTVDVFFIDYSTHEPFGQVSGVSQGGTVSTIWGDATKPGGVYQWYVVVLDIWLVASRSETWKFKIDMPPVPPANPIPKDNERYLNTSLMLSVDVFDPDSNSMTVTFFDGSDDSEIGVVENVPSGGTASINWNNLEYGTTYSWYAIADDGIFENKSKVFSFTTNFLPFISNILPEDESEDVSFYLDKLSIDISDPDGDSFDWSIKTVPDIGTNDGISEFDGTKTCDITNLKPLGIYVWNIEATDMRGATAKASYHFKTKENIAPVPNILSPKDKISDVSMENCILNWSCVDPDGDNDKLVYDVYFGKTNNPGIVAESITETYYNIAYELELDTSYYWKVVATDVFGATSKGDIWSFKTSSIPPPPAFGSINISFPKKFCWRGVKVSILNAGVRAASNVKWSLSVNGGIFDRINISKDGCFDFLNLSETRDISTYSFLGFRSNIFGIGRVNVTMEITDIDDKLVSTKSKDACVIGPILRFLD